MTSGEATADHAADCGQRSARAEKLSWDVRVGFEACMRDTEARICVKVLGLVIASGKTWHLFSRSFLPHVASGSSTSTSLHLDMRLHGHMESVGPVRAKALTGFQHLLYQVP